MIVMNELVASSGFGFRGQVIKAVENLTPEQRVEFLTRYGDYWELYVADPDDERVDVEYESWVSEWIEQNTAMFWEEGDLWQHKSTEPRDVQMRVLEKIKAMGFRHFDMSNWFQENTLTEDTRTDWDNEVGDWVSSTYKMWEYRSSSLGAACVIDIDNCGTTACLAGFTALVACELGDDEDVFGRDNYRGHNIAQYLGVDILIFHKGEWPRWMRDEWDAVEIGDTLTLVDEEELTGDADVDNELIGRREDEYRDWVVIQGFLEELIAGRVDSEGRPVGGGLQHT